MLYREMEQKVRDAFMKYYEENKPKEKKKEDSGNVTCSSSMYGCDVAPDYIIYECKGKKFKLFYDGGPENPTFDPLSEAQEVESKQEYVPVKESKDEEKPEAEEEVSEDSDTDIRDQANAMLRKMGQPVLVEDEDIPEWLMKKLNGKAKKIPSEKGAYAE
jgi:hypothetical protein